MTRRSSTSLNQSVSLVSRSLSSSTETTSSYAATFARKISGYAGENAAEAIAEAFSDVYCNGRNALKESHAIVYELKKYLKKS